MLLLLTAIVSTADEPTPLSLRLAGPGLELSWPATQLQADGSVQRPLFELQRSPDLTHWEPFGERQRAAALAPGAELSVVASFDEPAGFFRLLSVEQAAAALASGGAEVFGYGAAFDDALARIGQISPDEFAAQFPHSADYVTQLTHDPTAAAFWPQFNADPAVVNAGKEEGQPGFRTFDTRLTPEELAVFKTNGFVVSERLGSQSFAESFYDLWHNDLPVFISTDALLQAWHRTYDAMLQEVEETYLYSSAGRMLDAMAGQVASAEASAGNGVLRDSLRDADWLLAVARSLLAGAAVPSGLGSDERVAETLGDIQSEQLKEVPDFMGFCRTVDFSQFKVRGHYTRTERLSRYFQCVMWLGRIDLPVAGGPFERCPGDLRLASPRELGAAIVLWHLLHQSGEFQKWADMEKIISVFVGWTDSLNFGQLNGVLAGAGVRTLADVPDMATLERIQADLVRGELGVQNIRSDWFAQPLRGAERYGLPQTFTVFGQKFLPDSWAFSQTVFSSILWTQNGVTEKIQRRVPGALDAAFAVLGNDQVVPDLLARMKGQLVDPSRPHAQQFRDGLPYQHNLTAVRSVMDSQSPDAWSGSIYMSWLDCLRQLSQPTTADHFPQAMRTRSWAMKTLNTQLGSWTHLRHDTILYAKQSHTNGGDACLYPSGFVEPRVEFWNRLKSMAGRAAELIAGLNYEGSYTTPDGTEVAMTAIQDRQVAHLQNFAAVVGRLEALSQKELAQQCFSPEDLEFVDGLMESGTRFGGCSFSFGIYTGWYPQLFYRTVHWGDDEVFHGNFGAGAFDALVADVHTDVPCPYDECDWDPGSVLHEAVGRVNMLLLAVDNGADCFLCAGPVLSHYEFEVTGSPRRFSDEEWWSTLRQGSLPQDIDPQRVEGLTPPPWTQSYLVKMPP